MRRYFFGLLIATALSILFASTQTQAQGSDQEQDLAKKLSNPVAALISIPVQFNYDRTIGPADGGEKFQINIQPVVPFTLDQDWNLVSRTIVPIISQHDVSPGAGDQFGLGDITQSFFFSPAVPTAGGIIWGVGPVFLLPTGTDSRLTAGKWGIGPTAVVLTQRSGWTIGFLANHIWSVGGGVPRAEVTAEINATYLQPFVSYSTPDAWTFGVNTESTYDWTAKQWSVPVNASVSKIVKFGGLPVSLGGTVGYWAESPTNGPKDWRLRATFTLLLPR